MGQRSRSRHRTPEDDRTNESTASHLPVDETFSVLRNSRRRAVITHLVRTADGVSSVAKITQAVAAAEHGVPTEHVTERQRKCAYVSLLQVHLPTLEDAAVIEWDESTGTVEGNRSIEGLAGMIDLIERTCSPEAD